MENPWALFALVFAALPWFWARRKRPTQPPKRVAFPSVFLLIASKKRRLRSATRRRWLLAATRSALWTLIVLSWAGATWTSRPERFEDVASQTVEKKELLNRAFRVLIVDGSDSGFPIPAKNEALRHETALANDRNAAFYLALALNPAFDSDAAQVETLQDVPQVALLSTDEFSTISRRDLDAFDAIAWVDLSAPTAAELEKTRRFLTDPAPRPRALLAFAGTRTNVSRWNALWKGQNLEAQTIDVELDPATGTPFENEFEKLQHVGDKGVEEMEFRRPFATTPRLGLDETPIWRAFPVVGDDVVPLLCDKKSGLPIFSKILSKNSSASIFWFATVPDRAASALAFVPSFVPTVDRVFEFALADVAQFRSSRSENKNGAAQSVEIAKVAPPTRRRVDSTNAFWFLLATVATLEIVLTFSSFGLQYLSKSRY